MSHLEGIQPQVITVPGQLDIPGPSRFLSAHRAGLKAGANEWESTGDKVEQRQRKGTMPRAPTSAGWESEALQSWEGEALLGTELGILILHWAGAMSYTTRLLVSKHTQRGHSPTIGRRNGVHLYLPNPVHSAAVIVHLRWPQSIVSYLPGIQSLHKV